MILLLANLENFCKFRSQKRKKFNLMEKAEKKNGLKSFSFFGSPILSERVAADQPHPSLYSPYYDEACNEFAVLISATV